MRPGSWNRKWGRESLLEFPSRDFVGFLRLTGGQGNRLYRVVRLSSDVISFRPCGRMQETVPASGTRALGKPAAAEITVSIDRLLPKTVPVAGNDLGDIVLDYPPRKLDVGAPIIYGAIALFPQDADSVGARAAFDAQWIHVDTDWRRSQKLAVAPVTWKVLPDPEGAAPFKPTLEPCCLPRNGSPNWGYDDIITKRSFRDFQLHLEFNMMGLPDGNASPTGYSNSGVVVGGGGWFEIQIETPKNTAKATTTHDMASLLDTKMPDAFPWRPEGKWQAYDITFRYPRAGESGRVTVYWNGVLIHDNVAWTSGGGDKAGLHLQNEDGSDVRFRNVWIKELDIKDAKTNFGY